MAEGSGLIDIRAMAASTLGAASEGRSNGPVDDLPAFGSFSPAAPVLLPLQSSGAPKWIYPVVLVMVVFVGVIGFMVWKVLSARSPLEPERVVVQVPVPVPAPQAAPAVAKGGQDTKPSTIPDDKLPPRAAGDSAEHKAESKSEGKSERSEHHRGKGKEGKKVASNDDKKGGGAPAPETGEKRPAKGSIDDLLLGAVPNKKSGSSKGDDDPSRKAPESSAGPLSKSAVVAGMNSVKGKISECYSQFKVPGMAMVNVVIAKSGKVSSATVSGKFAGTPTGSCVEKAVKSASFPPSDGFTTPYPFQLR